MTYLLWFNFILGLNFILDLYFLLFLGVVICDNDLKQKKIIFKPMIKLNHNIFIYEEDEKRENSRLKKN